VLGGIRLTSYLMFTSVVSLDLIRCITNSKQEIDRHWRFKTKSYQQVELGTCDRQMLISLVESSSLVIEKG